MSASPGVPRPIVGALMFLIVTELTAWLALLGGPLSSRDEYLALLVWSLPLAAAVLLVGAWPRLRPADRLIRRGLYVVLCSVAIAWGWSVLVYYLSGGWVLGFAAPVLWCWTYGAVAGLLIVWAPPNLPGLGSAALSLTLIAALSAAVQWRASRVSVLIVYVRPGATAAQRNAIFDTVLGNPDSRGGHWPLDGISDIALSGSRGDTTLVRVTFDTWASRRNRDLAIRRLQGVPAVVARYVWLSGGGQKQVGTLRSAPVR